MAELPEPQVQVALLGLSPSRRDLLPELFHDPRARVCWVHAPDPESPLGRLARLFGFPLTIEPSEGALAGIEVLILPEEDGDSWNGEVPDDVVIVTDRELAAASGFNGFRWEMWIGLGEDFGSEPGLPDPPGRLPDSGPARPQPPASSFGPDSPRSRPLEPESPPSQRAAGSSHPDPLLAEPPAPESTKRSAVPSSQGPPGSGSQFPAEFPDWLPDMLSPRNLGGWMCHRIDGALQTTRPSLLIITRDREYLGAFRAGMGRRSWAFHRHARQLAARIARRSGAMPRDDEPGGGHSVVSLEQTSTVLLERCGLGTAGAVAISLPIGRRQQVWLLLPRSSASRAEAAGDPPTGRVEAAGDPPIARARLVLAAEREGLRLLARLLTLHDRARRWRLMRRMWHRLSNGFGPGLR